MPLSAMPKAVILPFEFYLEYLAVYVVIWLFGGHLVILLPSMYHCQQPQIIVKYGIIMKTIPYSHEI